MERRIGEIFEYNGEWYQCIKADPIIGADGIINYCERCAMSASECDNFYCTDDERSDKELVVFEKLEKVGEPYIEGNSVVCERPFQKYRLHEKNFTLNEKNLLFTSSGNIVSIEIKQNQENMEEKETDFIEKLNALCKKYNMPDGVRNDFISEVNEILNNRTSLNERELNLKPFDLEKAKEGKPVCTRDGREARIICFDRNAARYNIVALVECSGFPNKEEEIKVYFDTVEESPCDLMMLPEKKEGWVNLYKSSAHSTKEEAMKYRNKCNDYIDTIKISWEE